MHGLNFSYYLRHSGTVMHYFYFIFFFIFICLFIYLFFSGMSVVEGLDILPVGIVCIRVTQEY